MENPYMTLAGTRLCRLESGSVQLRPFRTQLYGQHGASCEIVYCLLAKRSQSSGVRLCGMASSTSSSVYRHLFW
ncbi:hypothetical protein CBR_g55381 [Chara braunii]|uniref:Uncharacterized protein n=1 Tax=Chara braunii TaxID=69332 RepID=A0A388K7M9_CHABU|nr:hypothetical protein CBR_g55381 [Chara braunii]|eukprot:GBG66037.1 hypothetical protein CBR_g55381 [Chara braunii]